MVWTILLVKQKDNGWFLNYIKSKLLEQINKLNLQNNIEIIISDNLPVIFGNYISIIDEIIDISDNFIESVYNVLKNSTKDYIGLKGKIIIDDNTFIFNNLDYTDNEIFIPITKLNPIKKEIVLNIQNYFSYDNLTSFVKNSDNIDNIVVFKENIKKESVSIIITAYKSQNFIEECLDSIINQSYFINNNNFEILVGVDGCAETYNKLSEIKHKYRNLNIYMMAENKGTYVTTNTLIDLTKFENILRFDSDDIMKPELVKEVFKHKKDNDLLMLGSVDLKDDKIGNEFLITPGIIFFKKSVMNIAGGYRSWLCAADSELISRLKDKIKISKINVALFYRRIHKNSLTSKPETGYGSTLRKEYIKQMNSYKGNIKIIKEVNKIVNKIENKSNLKIAFGMIVFNGDYVLKECLESIYPYASQILIAEGPVTYWQKKGFTTSADKTNEIIDNFRDPENKIKIIHSQYSEKDIQSNAYMKLVNPDIDYIWHIDSDELFHSEDIEKIINALEKEKYTTVRFRAYSFFGGFDRFISGYESSLPYVRIKKYYPGSYWSTHRPPTLTHLVKNVLPEKPIDSSSIGVYMYHYSHVFPDQVHDKIQYYKEFLRPTKVIDNYFNKIYLPWVIGNDNEKLEIEKLYGIDENIKRPSKSEVFGGQHPKAIVDNFKKLKNKFETQLKKYDSDEFRLSLIKNTTTTTTTVAPKTTTTTTTLVTTTTSTTTIKDEEKIPISIIITAYQTQDYIEECLDSIENQEYFKDNDNFEVLVGIDACEDTLSKVKEIMHKYRNLSVFMMDSNMGTYVTSNTLLDLIKYDNIIRFDSDDVMKPEMISIIVENIDDACDIIQFSYYNFYNDINIYHKSNQVVATGVLFFKKQIFNIVGGYYPWKCAADRELLNMLNDRVKKIEIKKSLFYRRLHNNSLTSRNDTGLTSELRQQYKKLSKDYRYIDNIKIDKKVNNYIQIKEIYEEKIPISIIVTAYQTQDYIEECLDSIENQEYFKDNNNFEVLVGIDACENTLSKVKEIMHKYRNLRVFMMDSNMGTYVTSNTLLDLIKYDNIIRFDSDDIMKPEMISEILLYIDEYDIIKFKNNDFHSDIKMCLNNSTFFPDGVILLKKKIFDLAGGYQPWKCAADTELLNRISNNFKIKKLEKYLYYRRVHKNSLTNRNDTGYNSDLRKEYINKINKINNSNVNIKINKIVNLYNEINNEPIQCIISRNIENNPFESVKEMILDNYSNLCKYNNILVILGYNRMINEISEYRKMYPNKKIVIYQLEQLFDNKSHWYNVESNNPYIIENTNKNKKRLNDCDEIWDYDLDNIEFLKNNGFKNIKHVPLQFTKKLIRNNNIKTPEYDLLFFGSVNDRRAKILSILARKYKLCIIAPKNQIKRYQNYYFGEYVIDSKYNDELFNYIFNSKIIINLHYYESKLLEQVRIFELLINNKVVISEKSRRNYYENLIYEFDDENMMIDKIDFVLKNNIWRNYNVSDKFKNINSVKKRILVTTSSFGTPLMSEWVSQITDDKYEIVFNRISSDNTFSKKLSMSPRLRAKSDRMLMWESYPDYDYYIWMDSSFSILRPDSIQWIVDQCTDDVDAVFFKHSKRNKIKDEFDFVFDELKNGNKYLLNRYYDEPLVEELNSYYLDSNFVDNCLIESGIFIYKNNVVKNKNYNIMKEWYYYNCKWSTLDQLSLPYLLQKFKIKYKFFDTTIYNNPYFKFVHWESVKNKNI